MPLYNYKSSIKCVTDGSSVCSPLRPTSYKPYNYFSSITHTFVNKQID